MFGAVQNTSHRHNIFSSMKNLNYRAFVDGILTSARQNIEHGEFTPETASKLKSIRVGLHENFYTDLADYDEAHVVSRFLKQCFSVSSRNRTVVERTEHEDEFLGRSDNSTVIFVLRHKFDDIDLRRSIANFARCFLSGSIAGITVRSNASANDTTMLQGCLISFQNCSHRAGPFICTNCALQLRKSAELCGGAIPPASQISCYIVDAAMVSSEEPSRSLAREVAAGLQCSVEVWK